MARHVIVVSDIYGESTTVRESSREPSYRELYDLASDSDILHVGHYTDSKLVHGILCDNGEIMSNKDDFYRVLDGD